ncbi:hypothetical protein ACIQTT_06315 [Microbacterium sp. NPDC090225]|uniref:hypothetical protein n=1 Tax=Microbacterium sp. NPDC090225 TaxID=3364207 RepID=UPI00383090CA
MSAEDELRALQARAYGREGGLDAQDAERLEELMRGAESGAETPPPRPAPRRPRWAVLAAVLAVGIVLGATGSWAVLALGRAEAPLLSAEQQGWQDVAFAEDGFDAGSAKPHAVVNDVVTWTATKGGGEWTCLVLGHAEHTVAACNPTDLVREAGLSASLTTGEEPGERTRVAADLDYTASGEPSIRATATDRALEPGAGPWSADESQVVDNLVAHGLDRSSLRIVGRDGSVPLWVGENAQTAETCLIVGGAGEPEMMCDELGQGERKGLSLAARAADGGMNATYGYAIDAGGESLVVTRQQAGGGPG